MYVPPEPAPDPLNVTGDPSHTVWDDPPTTLMLGKALTVTVIFNVEDSQPFASVWLTLYNVVPNVLVEGVRSDDVDNTLLLASYHFRVWLLNGVAKSSDGEASFKQYSVTFDGFVVGADGIAFTVTVTWSVPVQPFASVPVNVYVVVTLGVNDTPSLAPPLQL